MGAVTARRFGDEGAAVVLTGSQLDQGAEPDPCLRRDQTRGATSQCASVLLKVRVRLTTSDRRVSKFVRSIDPRTFADEAASVGDDNNGAVGRSLLPAMAPVLAGKDRS